MRGIREVMRVIGVGMKRIRVGMRRMGGRNVERDKN